MATYFWSNSLNCIYLGDMQPGDRLATEQEIAAHLAEEEVDTSLFDTACANFRQVCSMIGEFIGVENFHGGFDEYAVFIQSEAAQSNPAQASLLAAMWSGTNEYAKYEGAKLGYGQPEWWYRCWSIPYGETQEEEE